MTPDIVLTDSPTEAERDAILHGLIRFNNAVIGPSGFRPLAVLVKDPKTGKTLGGLSGASFHGWLFVELLWLPEALRRGGIGSQLIRRAEAEATRRGCRGVLLDTYDFQARPFYEKHGYQVFGTLDDAPPGHQRFYLAKRLVAAR